MRTVTTKRGQTAFDIALQTMGSIEGIVEIMKLNSSLRMDAEIEPGTLLFLPDKPVNKRVVDYYEKHNLTPVSVCNSIVVDVMKSVHIILSGSSETYSPVFELPFIDGYLDAMVTVESLVLPEDGLTLAVFGSFDGKIWNLIGSEKIFPQNIIDYSFRCSANVQTDLVKMRFITYEIQPNAITKIKYSYEKYC
jgi:hypothetical protein